MNEKLPPPPTSLSLPTTATTIMEPTSLSLPPIDTEGASTYHITAAQVPLEFGGTLKSSKGSKNNSNQQSPQKKSRSSSGVPGGGGCNNNSSNNVNQSGSYCTCFGGCGYGHRSRIAMPFWPAVLANLGICALLAGYIFIGSFIFLTIENSNERVVSLDASLAQHTAQLPQIIQKQQQQQQYQTTAGSSSQKQADNKLVVNTHNRNVRSARGSGKGGDGDGGSGIRHLAKSTATSTATPEVSTHINGMHDDDDDNSDGNADVVDDDGSGGVAKRQHSIVASSTNGQSSRKGSNVLRAKHSTQDDYDLQTLPLAAAAAAGDEYGVDEDYIGDDDTVASTTLSVEDVERRRTVENIWDITVSLNILYKENWTRLAALEIAKFQDQLVKRLVMDLTLSTSNGATQSTAAFGRNGKQWKTTTGFGNFERQRFWTSENTQQQLQNNQRQHHWWNNNQRINRGHRGRLRNERFEWTFATAFLYSMTVITTVGYGTITARTTLGRMVTIGYATLGIPLTLVYLSSVGSVLAKILRYFCNTNAAHRRGICCCCCLRRPRTQQRQGSIGSSSIFNRHPQVADRKTELKLKHFQQPQQQQPLPYCYVRPPATTAQEMEMQQHSGSGGGGGGGGVGNISGVAVGSTFDNLSVATSGTETSRQHARAAAAVLSWSLAGPAGFCVLFLIAYVTFGAVVIALLEDWPLIDGIYFCFMSLSTIGFCDLLPGLRAEGSHGSQRTSTSTAASTTNVAVWFCAAYILSGLTLTSMCVNLLHDEIASRMRVVVKFEKVHELQQEQRESGFYSSRS